MYLYKLKFSLEIIQKCLRNLFTSCLRLSVLYYHLMKVKFHNLTIQMLKYHFKSGKIGK